MATLFEILNDMVGEDITQHLSQQQIQDVNDKIEAELKQKIGSKDYRDLESYITNNKDDVYLKSLTMLTLRNVGGVSQAMRQANVDIDKIEVMLGYKILFRMYEILRLSSYDAEKALMEL